MRKPLIVTRALNFLGLRRYVREHGAACPHCESSHRREPASTSLHLNRSERELIRGFECPRCGGEWLEVFRLARVVLVNPAEPEPVVPDPVPEEDLAPWDRRAE